MKKKKNKKIGDVLGKNKGKSWLYTGIVKDHFFHPRNVLLDERNYQYDGKGIAGNPLCGDMMALWIKVDPKTQKIKDCKWRTYGCASAIAATSMMSVMVTEKGGMPVKKALNLKAQQIIERLGGLPELKFHCSVLGLSALKEAINDYFKSKEAE
jgi:NifU-like protein involved in Fe-S cluster formation